MRVVHSLFSSIKSLEEKKKRLYISMMFLSEKNGMYRETEIESQNQRLEEYFKIPVSKLKAKELYG